MNRYFVYMVRCADGTLYTGYTVNDVQARVATHNEGRGAKYTKSRRPVELVYCAPQDSRSAALRQEAAIKRLSRAEKWNLIQKEGIQS